MPSDISIFFNVLIWLAIGSSLGAIFIFLREKGNQFKAHLILIAAGTSCDLYITAVSGWLVPPSIMFVSTTIAIGSTMVSERMPVSRITRHAQLALLIVSITLPLGTVLAFLTAPTTNLESILPLYVFVFPYLTYFLVPIVVFIYANPKRIQRRRFGWKIKDNINIGLIFGVFPLIATFITKGFASMITPEIYVTIKTVGISLLIISILSCFYFIVVILKDFKSQIAASSEKESSTIDRPKKISKPKVRGCPWCNILVEDADIEFCRRCGRRII